MKESIRIALHETFEIHELLTIKNITATKCAAMSALVKDTELKDIMRMELDLAQTHITELSKLLESSVLNEPGTSPEDSPGKAVLH
jgi:similar to spore coat protein